MLYEKKKDYLAFIIGLFAMVKVRYFGTFAVAELIVFALTPFVAWRFYKTNPSVRKLLWLAFLWLMGVIFSDYWNDSSLIDSLKGAFNVIFVILLIPFTYWILYDKPQRWLLYFCGFSISSLYNFYYQRAPEFDNDFVFQVWRVYAFYPLAVCLAGWLFYNRKKYLSYIIIVGFGIWSLYNSSRNIFLSQSLAVVVLLYINRLKNVNLQTKVLQYQKKIMQLLVMLVAGFCVVVFVYESMASSGALGERVHEKYLMQKYSRDGLISARGDALQSIYAISKKPLVGYGSYAKDRYGIINKYNYRRDIVSDFNDDDLIPGHSYILGAWVYSGIFGFCFFAYILKFLLKSIKSGWMLYYGNFVGPWMYVMLMMIWDILFSPFSDRINLLFFIISLMIAERMTKSSYVK